MLNVPVVELLNEAVRSPSSRESSYFPRGPANLAVQCSYLSSHLCWRAARQELCDVGVCYNFTSISCLQNPNLLADMHVPSQVAE